MSLYEAAESTGNFVIEQRDAPQPPPPGQDDFSML